MCLVLCEINHPNVTNRRKPLKRSKCYEDLPAIEPVKKSRKRKSTGDEVDQEMVKRLRQSVEQVISKFLFNKELGLRWDKSNWAQRTKTLEINFLLNFQISTKTTTSLGEQEKRAEQLYLAIKSRVKLSMSDRQDKKVKQIAIEIEKSLRREYGLDQKQYMHQYR